MTRRTLSDAEQFAVKALGQPLRFLNRLDLYDVMCAKFGAENSVKAEDWMKPTPEMEIENEQGNCIKD